MPNTYTVQQGDFLPKIAHNFGFASYLPIWNHPNNAQLKSLRQDPCILFPGDTLFIPARETREEDRSTDARHTFKKKVPPLDLELILEDMYGQPVSQAACSLAIGDQTNQLTTAANGLLKQKIQPTAHDAALAIPEAPTPLAGSPIAIKIGDLDPLTEFSGQAARLRNLGYLIHSDELPDPAQFEAAVEEFQCEAGIAVDGICGPVTRAKLKAIHGC